MKNAANQRLTASIGKTGRTVSANGVEIQYVVIIGGPLLTYLLTGTDRLERTILKEMSVCAFHSAPKGNKLSKACRKSQPYFVSWIRKFDKAKEFYA